ncbi:hypothetical protein IV454_07970 [Massilia antarctica]|uniref:WD40 repeat domain-containing protein n=1 Tax=Massilia antarctica TaxID=2765360 RepID=A0AA48WG72_9BURK|nr:hypothetical protein [Massilia antarctica]QPI51441.1 hypothetical protein IV454_07970 [Massilia antarctica]
MNPFLDEKRWTEVFSDFEIVDLAIQEKGILQMCARKKTPLHEASLLFDSQIPTRIISLFTGRPTGDNCGYQELEGMAYPVVGVARAPFPRPSGLVASKNRDGDVWPRGNGNGPLEHIAPGKSPFPEKLKCIGSVTYSVGAGRAVYKRVEVGKWVPFQDGFPTVEVTTGQGFRDLDAFSPSDMYAVGGHGDVWHYDGARWKQMGFPSNVQLATVTCAGDGNVYISGEGGSLWMGEKSTWKSIYHGTSSILWNDVLWFQNRLWLSSDYQFRQWDGKELIPVEHEGKTVSIWGHMDVFDGLLAIASPQHVKSFDGQAWTNLVSPFAA